jgi:hypothetical protein
VARLLEVVLEVGLPPLVVVLPEQAVGRPGDLAGEPLGDRVRPIEVLS